MKRAKKSRATVAPAAVPDESSTVPREAHDESLQPGDVVMLPDGGMAAIERIVGRDAYVVEWQKTVGRGPWIFPISELVPVT